MEKRKKYLFALSMLLIIGISTKMVSRRLEQAKKEKGLETTMIANDPVATTDDIIKEEPSQEMSLALPEKVMDEEKVKDRLLVLEPVERSVYRNNKVTGTYGYVMLNQEKLNGMSREEYHAFIDQISKYSYEYFTVVLNDGTGIVYHPMYAYWGIYCNLDSNHYVKSVIHYIDALDDEVGIVTESMTGEVRTFMSDITKKYQKNGYYSLKVDFLYDSIYQVDLSINVKSDDFRVAKEAIKEIEQKSKSRGYKLNFKITCKNNGNDIVTFTFGEENPQYVYIENKHRVVLDSLE